MPDYVPQKGDFVMVTLDPQSGHEQKGRRPAFWMPVYIKAPYSRSKFDMK